jgi:hypothetical protein
MKNACHPWASAEAPIFRRNISSLFVLLSVVITHGLILERTAEAAKKKAVVLSFSGANSGAARGGVTNALKAKVTLISTEKYKETAEELGVDGGEADGMVAVCAKLKCDAVIKGSVGGKGRRFTLVVTVFDGGTGEALGRRAATVRGAKKIGRAGSAVGAQCLSLVQKGKFRQGRVAKVKAKPSEPEPEPEHEKPRPPPADVSDIPEYKPVKQAKRVKKGKKKNTDDEGGEDNESSEEGDDEEGRVSKKGGKTSYDGLLDVSICLGLSSRKALIQGDVPDQDRSYDGGMYPEVVIRAELYPFAPFTRGFVRNVGLGLSYGRHLSISSKDKDGNPVDTGSQELLLDLRLRWKVLKTITSPVLSFFGGFGMRDFTLGTNETMASFKYKVVRIGAEGIIPLGSPLFALFLGADVRPILSPGGSSEGDSVYHYGAKTAGLGYSVRGGAYGKHSLGLFYFLTFELLQFKTSFAGLGSGITNMGALDRADPSTHQDRFLRFWVGGGYAL